VGSWVPLVQVTVEQQYVLIEYISHLVSSDYERKTQGLADGAVEYMTDLVRSWVPGCPLCR